MKILELIANAAFWIFIGGMFFSMFKQTHIVSAFLLTTSVVLFVIYLIAKLIQKLMSKKSGGDSVEG